jgi:hypothetical protein
MGFAEFMSEKREVNRWFVLRIALIGAFAGALLAFIFAILGIVRF